MEEKFLHAEEQGAEKSSQFQTNRDLNNPISKTLPAFDLNKLKGRNTFCRNERLRSQKIIEQLFKEGKSVSRNGFTLVYSVRVLNSTYPAQAGFAVPKKFFKRAVDRNRIKRLMREAYRTNKFALYEKLVKQQQQLAMMWVYKGKEVPEYETALKSIMHCLKLIL